MTSHGSRSVCMALAAALLLLLSACGSGGALPPVDAGLAGQDGSATLEGRLAFESGAQGAALRSASRTLAEVEPNDSIDTAQALGVLQPGARILVTGHAAAANEDDPFDGYRLQVSERALVTVRLLREAADPAPFDLAVYDDTSLQVTAAFHLDAAEDHATFHARGTSTLVLRAADASADYRLELSASLAGPDIAVPSTTVAALPLGDLRAGDELTLHGSADGRVALLTCPTALTLHLERNADTSAEAQIELLDGTEDIRTGRVLGTLEATKVLVHSADAGSLLVLRAGGPPGARFHVRLRCAAVAPDAVTARVARTERIAPLALEALAFRLPLGARRFGLPMHPIRVGKALVCFEDVDEAGVERAVGGCACRVEDYVADGAACTLGFDVPANLDRMDAARMTWSRILGLRTLAGLRYAEPSYRRFRRAEPNDPRYDDQWNYPLIDLPKAWDITTGSSKVIVAVIDTGKTNHPDLAGQQVGGYDFISDRSIAGDGDGRDDDPTDVGDGERGEPSSFHGTHVAGTIGASSDNKKGVAGVCWDVEIMHLRVLGVGGGEDADINNAIRYAARLKNASGTLPDVRADVINMSLGGGGFNQAMQDAITDARKAGVVVFAAAGNSGTSAKEYPASFDGVVSVMAVDRDKSRASYSNKGSTVDLGAPGGDTWTAASDGVLSTMYDDSQSPAKATYVYYDGTSMATPHAAGVAALVRSVDATLTPAQVEKILFDSATDLGAKGRDNLYGNGLVNAYAAVLAARDGLSDDPSLALSPTALDFDAGTSSLEAAVSNGGSGRVTVTGVRTSTEDGGAWLAAEPFGSGDATINADGIRVTVTRDGLAGGTYRGSVAVASNGGERQVTVTMRVGDAAGGSPTADMDVYVQLVSVATDETVEEVLVPAGTEPTFRFEDIQPGTYYLVAGSDADEDGWMCDVGDWCGFSEDFEVADGDALSDVVLSMTRDAGQDDAPPTGFVRPRR